MKDILLWIFVFMFAAILQLANTERCQMQNTISSQRIIIESYERDNAKCFEALRDCGEGCK